MLAVGSDLAAARIDVPSLASVADYVLLGGTRNGQRVRTARPRVELRFPGERYRVTPERREGFQVALITRRRRPMDNPESAGRALT